MASRHLHASSGSSLDPSSSFGSLEKWRTGKGVKGPKPDGKVRDIFEIPLGTSLRPHHRKRDKPLLDGPASRSTNEVTSAIRAVSGVPRR
jgi:hypothetical protein